MKNLLLIAALFIGLGLSSGYAQDDNTPSSDEQTYSKNEVGDDGLGLDKDDPATSPADKKADHKDKSKAGNALHKTGSAIGGGVKWTGKKIGEGAKWTGGKVKQGANWTWGKTKHNKATKNTFNQPGDE